MKEKIVDGINLELQHNGAFWLCRAPDYSSMWLGDGRTMTDAIKSTLPEARKIINLICSRFSCREYANHLGVE